jgi:hypothetical protein
MSALDEILKDSKRRDPGCKKCGAPTEARVQIQIRKGNRDSGPSKTRVLSLCETHAVELWTRIHKEMFP